MRLENLLLTFLFTYSFAASGFYEGNIGIPLEPNSRTETVVFLHGAGSSPATWQKVGPKFESIFNALYYDTSRINPLHAQGDGNILENLPLQTWAQDLASFLDEKNAESVHLVSHSFGARLAIKFWEIFPKRVKSIVIEDMDLMPRNFPEHTSDPFNYPAASSDLRYVFNLLPSIPILVLAAKNDHDYEAITSDGLKHYETLENKFDQFKLTFVDGASHSIHKSKSYQFINEIFRFYIKQGVIPAAIKHNVKNFIQNSFSFSDFLTVFFEPSAEMSPIVTNLIMDQFIEGIKSIDDLFEQVKNIWQFKDVDIEKCRELMKFYQESRSQLLQSIYSKEYFSKLDGTNLYIGKYKVSQLEWVLVNRYSNPAFHKRIEFCPDSYGELFGVPMCMDHPIENISFFQIQRLFINVLAGENIFVDLPPEKLVKNELALILLETKKIEKYRKKGRTLRSNAAAFKNLEYEINGVKAKMENYIWCEENSNNQTQPVDSKIPISNIFGLAGNTTEFFRSEDQIKRWGMDYTKSIGDYLAEEVSNKFRSPENGFRLVWKNFCKEESYVLKTYEISISRPQNR